MNTSAKGTKRSCFTLAAVLLKTCQSEKVKPTWLPNAPPPLAPCHRGERNAVMQVISHQEETNANKWHSVLLGSGAIWELSDGRGCETDTWDHG